MNLPVGAAPTRFEGESGTNEAGKARLDGSIALTQHVVFGVRYDRRVLLVVALVMRGNFSRKPLKFGLGLRFRKLGRIDFQRTATWHARTISTRGLDQPLGGGASFVGDLGAGEHAGDLLAPAF